VPIPNVLTLKQNLALNQEWIELDLFHYGLAKFSVEEFEAAGLYAEDRFLIEFMADQEVGHATLLSNILGRTCYVFSEAISSALTALPSTSHRSEAMQLYV